MLVVVGGATGTGKSRIALDIAEALGRIGRPAEVVNADAMQLYRGMDIGTAKIPVTERRGITHHMLDVLDVNQDATVAAYQAATRSLISTLASRGITPVLVGGTGLYIDAVIHRLEFPGTDPAVRLHWENELAARGPGALAQRLREVDSASAQAIDSSDGRRLVRALEVWELTGRPFSDFTQWANVPWCEYRMVVLDEPQETLAQSLRERADTMWASGLVEETKELKAKGLNRGTTAGKAIGYAQALAHLDGGLDLAEARQQTATATIQYARRQRTWFRRYKEAMHESASSLDSAFVARSAAD